MLKLECDDGFCPVCRGARTIPDWVIGRRHCPACRWEDSGFTNPTRESELVTAGAIRQSIESAEQCEFCGNPYSGDSGELIPRFADDCRDELRGQLAECHIDAIADELDSIADELDSMGN